MKSIVGNKKIHLLFLITIIMSFCVGKMSFTSASSDKVDASDKNDLFKVTLKWDVSILGSYNNEEEESYVEIQNLTNDDFEGTLQIIPYSNQKRIEEYDFAVGAKTKNDIRVYLRNCVYGYNEKLIVKIINKDEEEIYSKTFLTVIDSDRTYSIYNIAILSDTKDRFDYLEEKYESSSIPSNKKISLYSSRVSYWDKLPEDEQEIYDAGYIIISDYDTSKLTKEDKNILEKYVSGGGVIIVGTGDKAETTLSGLDFLIDYTYHGSMKSEYDESFIYENKQEYEATCDEARAYEFAEEHLYDVYYDETVEEIWDSVWKDYYDNDIASRYFDRYNWTKYVFDSDGQIKDFTENDSKYIRCDYADFTVNNAKASLGIKGGKYDLIKHDNGRIYVFHVNLSNPSIKAYFNYLVYGDDNYYSGDSESIIIDDGNLNQYRYIIFFIIYIICVSFGVYFLAIKLKKTHYLFWGIIICAVVFGIFAGFFAERDCKDDALTYVTINKYTDEGICYSNTSLSIVNVSGGDYEYDIATSSYLNINSIEMSQSVWYADQLDYNYYSYEEIDKYYGTVKMNETSGNDNKKIKISDMLPYSMCNLGYHEQIETDKSFELVKKDDSWYVINATGKDVDCAVMKSAYGFIYIGKINAGAEVRLSDYSYLGTNLKASIMINDNVDEELAKVVRNQYSNVIDFTGSNKFQLIALEGTVNTALGDDWCGLTIATQSFESSEDIIPVTDGTKISNKRYLIGSFEENTMGGIDKQGDDTVIMMAYDEVIALYTIPEGTVIKNLQFSSSEINDFIKAVSDKNKKYIGEYYIYNYDTRQYDKLNPVSEFWIMEDMHSYYGDNKPVRIKICVVESNNEACIIPDFTLEVE